MMQQKIDPSIGFRTLVVKLFQIIPGIFQENQVDGIETGKLLKGDKCNEKIKKFCSEKMKKILFLNYFFLMMEQKTEPPT